MADQKIDAIFTFEHFGRIQTINNMDVKDFEILKEIFKKYGIQTRYRMISIDDNGFPEFKSIN